ncbi:MAG: alpha/beta hydrolase [Spirochaetota bacterium]
MPHPAPPSPHPLFPNETIELWPDGSPNNGSNPDYRPMIRIYYPASWPPEDDPDALGDPRPAVLVCPGGGYTLQARHEGQPFAQLLAMHGVVAAVLTYRVAPDAYPAPYADAVRAMRILRSRAGHYGIDAARIGIMGFSAGGHLASLVATQPDLYHDPHDELAGSISARPYRAILGYPVISLGEDAHVGSLEALLGPNPEPGLRRQLSSHLHVSADSPPAFLFHTADDPVVPVTHSLLYAQACVEHGVPVELHVYEHGRHGVGLALDDERLRGWSGTMVRWLLSA